MFRDMDRKRREAEAEALRRGIRQPAMHAAVAFYVTPVFLFIIPLILLLESIYPMLSALAAAPVFFGLLYLGMKNQSKYDRQVEAIEQELLGKRVPAK